MPEPERVQVSPAKDLGIVGATVRNFISLKILGLFLRLN